MFKKLDHEQVTRKEMMAMRLFRGYNRVQMSKKIGVSDILINDIEKGYCKPLTSIKKRYVEALKITSGELSRLRMALAGELTKLEEKREIPDVIKDDILERSSGKCEKCGGGRKFHFHHKKKFSKGGLHSLGNIIMLCVGCHAEAHKNDREYAMLKAIAEKVNQELGVKTR